MNYYNNPARQDWEKITLRPAVLRAEMEDTIKMVFDAVKSEGDEALKRFTLAFDNANLDTFQVSKEKINTAATLVDPALKDAILAAKNNIEKFHSSQRLTKTKVETTTGVFCWQESRPIEKVGLYIPGGTAPLFSTVLMLGIPAKLAGCKEIILCTPPDQNGEINPAILYTANLVGIEKIFRIGGAQAIAAMTLGTESIPKVYKILGPGNQYVTAAKELASRLGTAIDMPAGPSELMVIADETSNPPFVAADLLSQAEHGTDSQVICLANSMELLKKIEAAVQIQIQKLPRKNIAEGALENSKFICFKSKVDTINFCNLYAPEHLILAVADMDFYIKNLNNAGSVFLGNYAPESAGDYASGTNHTLPTNGFAKSYSGVSLDSFVKKITFQEISKQGIRNIGPIVEKMAFAEQLQAHKNAVTIRLEALAEEERFENREKRVER